MSSSVFRSTQDYSQLEPVAREVEGWGAEGVEKRVIAVATDRTERCDACVRSCLAIAMTRINFQPTRSIGDVDSGGQHVGGGGVL